MVDSTTENEHRLGGAVRDSANLEWESRASRCQVAEAWRINLTDDITNTLESPFENVLRAGTAHQTSLDSRESDLDERMAKVAHLHVEDPGGQFGPGSDIAATWPPVDKTVPVAVALLSPCLFPLFPPSRHLMLIFVWNCFSIN